MATSTSRAAQASVATVAEALGPRLDAYAVVMGDEIHAGMDELSEELRELTVRSCRANIGLICALMQVEETAAAAHAPGEALAYAREVVRHGLSIEVLMRTYRIGHQVFWRELLDALQRGIEDHDELAAAVQYASDWTFAYVDTVSGGITAAYIAERERWVRSAEAVRAEEVRAILSGAAVDEQDASRRMRYELHRRHVGLVVWGVGGAEDAERTGSVGDLEHIAQDLVRRLGGTDLLSVALGGTLLACWTAVPEGQGLADVEGGRIAPGEHEVRVAVGEPHDGLAGFRRSHEEAMLARRMALLAGRSPGAVVRYPDIALNALLSADLDGARRFAERELGGLTEETDAVRRLAATLKVFFDEGTSFVKAARRLGIHENTVAYRVRRAADLLGHPVDERQLEVRVALQLLDLLRRADRDGVTAATP